MTEPPEHRISVHLDELLQAKGMTLVELSSRVGVTVVNLSILKNGHARAIRFNTLTAICDALGCTPGEPSACKPDRRDPPEIQQVPPPSPAGAIPKLESRGTAGQQFPLDAPAFRPPPRQRRYRI